MLFYKIGDNSNFRLKETGLPGHDTPEIVDFNYFFDSKIAKSLYLFFI